jgi:biotin carboxylase
MTLQHPQELILLAHVPTDAVNEGFLPAAKALGLKVLLLTDCADAHRAHFAQAGRASYPDEILACDVFNPLAVIDAITRRAARPAAVFSNSDHLQSATAVTAAYFGLPGKEWRTTYQAKNKAEMRAYLAELGIDTLWHAVVCSQADLAAVAERAPLPCVVKPREGVASQQVGLARSHAELQALCAAIWAQHPGQPLLLEEYIAGPLYTLETLGDGKDIVALGGFRVALSPPPHFVELEAIWGTGLPQAAEDQVLDIIRRFGIGFGACHTEFVMTATGPRLIEINYRTIGDYREFLLADALRLPLFEQVLRLYLGEALPAIDVPQAAAWIRYFTADEEGTLRQAPPAFERDGGGVRLSYQPLRAAGEAIRLTHSNKDYLGVLRGSAASHDRLASAIEQTSKQLAWEIA